MPTLIIAATEFELALLVESLHCRQESRLFDCTVYRTGGSTDAGPVLMRSGAGMANAAAAAALGIERYKPDRIFNVGVCGVCNAGMEAIGQAVTGTRAVFADTGVDTGADFLSLQAIDLPLAKPASGERVFNAIGLHAARGNRNLKRAAFLTVSACSGSLQRAALVSRRFACERQELLCEDMESAAVALMACKAGIPCSVVRAISNVCGDRNYTNWQLSTAAHNAQKALLTCL
jgi:adenosylhomocysteine nucleosidase